MFPQPQPVIPYGEQTPTTALETESGHRSVRGILTEGRFLVFQDTGSGGLGLGVPNTQGQSDRLSHPTLVGSPVPSSKEADLTLRFVIFEQAIFPEPKYQIRSAFLDASSSFLDSNLEFTSQDQAATFTITYNPDGTSYTVQVESSGKYVSIEGERVSLSSSPFEFFIFSVT